MATIKLSFPFTMPAKDVKKILEQLGKQLGGEYSAAIAWQGNVFSFQRSGIDGTITLGEHELKVNIQLGMMTSMLKSRIEKEISHYCKEHLR
jgi:putative polyhydroxyalkanoate system protein